MARATMARWNRAASSGPRANRYGGICRHCKTWVAPGVGRLVSDDACWKVEHRPGWCRVAATPIVASNDEYLDLSALDEGDDTTAPPVAVAISDDVDVESLIQVDLDAAEETVAEEYAASLEERADALADEYAALCLAQRAERCRAIDESFGLRPGEDLPW